MSLASIYTICYNESLQIKFFIDFYRARFKDCEITIYDHMSTDNTAEIAKNNNCIVIPYDTNNKIVDSKYLEIKNNCWKNSRTNWNIIVDSDECLDITEEQLKFEEYIGTTIIKSIAYNMINLEDNLDIYNIKYGVRAPMHDKHYCFNKKYISDIGYEPGCHVANSKGMIKYSEKAYPAYHFNFINEQLSIEKYKLYGSRLSDENKRYGWGSHYLHSAEKVKEEFQSLRKNAIKIL